MFIHFSVFFTHAICNHVTATSMILFPCASCKMPRSGLFLTVRAKVGASLDECDLLNWGTAALTGLSLAMIDPEFVLKMTAFIGPVKTGTVVFDREFQRTADRLPQPSAFFLCQVVPSPGRQNARVKKGLIRIDIPDPSDKTLIQQDRLDSPMLSAEMFNEPLCGKLITERLHPQSAQDILRLFSDPDPPEFPHIIKNQPGPIRKMKDHPVMGKEFFRIIRLTAQISAHPQVDEDRGFIC